MKHLRKFKQFESKIFYNTDSTDYDTQEEYTEKMPSYYDYKNGKITEKDFPNINPKVKNMHLKDKINLNDLHNYQSNMRSLGAHPDLSMSTAQEGRQALREDMRDKLDI